MLNTHRLQNFRQLIYDTLDPLITKNYCLLDIPDHPNVGDQLIYEGEMAYLQRLNYKLLYEAADKFEEHDKIPGDCTILFHGGGNFGDLYRTHQRSRLGVIKKFRDNKIMIFPQTVYYRRIENLIEEAKIYEAHPDLTICARDTFSYNLLTKYLEKTKVILLPDMAFCLDLSKFITPLKTRRTLFFKRKDKELNSNFNLESLKMMVSKNQRIDVTDWPSHQNVQPIFKLMSLVNFLNTRISKRLFKSKTLRPLVNSKYGLLRGNLSRWYTMSGIRFINKYDEIYTTRLHGYILSVLLNKKVHLMDNSYGKNSNFYYTWMTEFDKSYYLANELPAQAKFKITNWAVY